MAKNLFERQANQLVNFSRLWGYQAWLVFLVVFSLCVTLIIFTIQSPVQSRNQPSEIRGVWLTNIDSDVLFSKKTLSEAIATLKQFNFNTLYPTVWNWGHTLYPSEVAQPITGTNIDPAEGLQGRDILQEIVNQGHQANMAVIPWFEFGFMAPADSQLAKNHPQWLTQRKNGDRIWLEGKVHKRVWLNPLNPEVQTFITNLVTEIVSKYEVDGIQFDDHFGIPFDFGYDNVTLALYQQEHQGKLPPNPPKKLKATNNCTINDQVWQEWTRWRAEKITGYMTELFKAIKATNPSIIVSLSPNPQPFSANCYLLDWHQWERRGLIEELVLQVYRPNLRDFQRELGRPEVQEAKQHIPFGVGVLSGLKDRPVPMEQIIKQVETIRQKQFSGISFFFYESLWNFGTESPKERQSGYQKLFPTKVSRPEA
ncbi:glycoside hydrolase family 10 protein [cyanobacterium endosymbiont of Epithemia clementina EcSB]|uniref:glycoside hydrolase family 10 protein n=1 Tax=cyanobacterium endosymbiont of Epithemia clementina EcSB TaxID=3034674 RepID=UPI0024807B58|nr:glycoside hydrolase family 10 protein [cyanobacterium endosymbiont of Epithemia clementina EcSB]WGT68217.1 glycoside hydrolase family 10 protein [cyanobacterium endosymbiont of Epithemia clementina EcSB]